MARTYDVQWANGESFKVFKSSSQIEIDGWAGPDYKDAVVTFINSNLGQGAYQIPAQDVTSNDGYTLEITLLPGTEDEARAVMVEWLDTSSNTWTLFGEVFVGDPNGAGGFGGEQGGGSGTVE